MNFLKKMMGTGASALPFTIGKECHSYQGQLFKMHEGTKKSDGEEVSVFTFEKESAAPSAVQTALHAFQNSSKYRHPFILRYLEGQDMDNQTVFCTEKVRPLLDWAEGLEESTRDDEITWGLYCLFNALKFLHEDCKVSHSNIGAHSIFVTNGGDWKIGGMALLGDSTDQVHINHLIQAVNFVPTSMLAPEIAGKDWPALRGAPRHAPDVWGAGAALEAVYARCRGTTGLPAGLGRYHAKMAAADPARRAPAAKFLQAKMFKAPLVEGLVFLGELHLKEPEERALFFRRLAGGELRRWPPAVVDGKVLALLLGDLELAARAATANPQQAQAQVPLLLQTLPLVLRLAGRLGAAEFQRRAQPALAALYGLGDRGVRVALLGGLPHYADKLDEALVNGSIFDQVCMGFQDNSPAMREVTLKSMIHFVDHLSDKNLNDKLVKYLSRLQGDTEAGLRTNATILLGKVAGRLSEKTRDKVLVPALIRGLRDPFPHARMAAVRTMGAVSCGGGGGGGGEGGGGGGGGGGALVAPPRAAAQLLPAAVPLLADPTGLVRREAFKVVEQLLGALREHSLVLDREEEERERRQRAEQAAAGTGGQGAASGGVATTEKAPSSSDGSGWASWALGKVASAAVGAAPAPAPAQASQGKGASAAAAPLSAGSGPNSAPTSQRSGLVPPTSLDSHSNHPAAEKVFIVGGGRGGGMKLDGKAPVVRPPPDVPAPLLPAGGAYSSSRLGSISLAELESELGGGAPAAVLLPQGGAAAGTGRKHNRLAGGGGWGDDDLDLGGEDDDDLGVGGGWGGGSGGAASLPSGGAARPAAVVVDSTAFGGATNNSSWVGTANAGAGMQLGRGDSSSTKNNAAGNSLKIPGGVKKLAAETSKDFWDDF